MGRIIQENYYNLIYDPPKFNKFTKDTYYSLIHVTFLEFIGIKARETDLLTIAKNLL